MFLGGLRDVPSPGTAPDPTLHPTDSLGPLVTRYFNIHAHRALSLVDPPVASHAGRDGAHPARTQ